MSPEQLGALLRANLYDAIADTEMTQAEVAAKAWPLAKADTRERRLRRALSGDINLTMATLAGLCVALAVGPHELFRSR